MEHDGALYRWRWGGQDYRVYRWRWEELQTALVTGRWKWEELQVALDSGQVEVGGATGD